VEKHRAMAENEKKDIDINKDLQDSSSNKDLSQEPVSEEKQTDEAQKKSTPSEELADKGTSEEENKTSDQQETVEPTQDSIKKEKNESEQSGEDIEENEDIVSSDEEDDEEEVEDEFYGIPVRAYDEMNLDALGEELERLLKGHKIKEIRSHVREIKMEFDSKFGKERDQKKQEFLDQGGNIIDFSYSTAAERKFNKLYFEFKEKRDNYYKNVRKNLQENLERRLTIIEELKAITGVGTDMNANFKAFKKLQDSWRKAGPVPRNDYKDTWNTYHYHVERFYDFLHLDREFREMDYKHNLEQKLKMIARAEELAAEKDVNRAFRELQNLHRMWKEDVGPVAQEYSEAIWEKFSAATKQIHENRREYFAERDKKREDNLELKKSIISEIEQLAEGEVKSHRQAQNKIKKLKELRDQFFEAGKVPRKDSQATWDAFKEATREFNHKKNEFYKNRKEEHKENLRKKLELIEIAEKHQDSDDFDTITPLMKKIQSDWKKIGYVQRNKSDKIWKRFKKACNHYFDRLHARQDQKEKSKMDSFHKKAALLDETKALPISGNKEEDLAKIKEQIEKWKEIGRVPSSKRGIEGRFNKVLDQLFKKLDINRQEAELLKYENRLQSLEKEDDDYQIEKEAFFLRKKIDQTSDEIRQLETNLQFFDNVDKNNPLMRDTFKKMEQLRQQLKIWQAKLDRLKDL